MVDSVHFARWVNSISTLRIKIYVLPSGPNRSLHPLLKKDCTRPDSIIELNKVFATLSLPIWLADRLLGGRLRALFICYLLSVRRFEIIHFHEMQSGGYPLAKVPRKLIADSKVFYTPYGSDLFWFQKFAKHRKKIREVLGFVDGIFPECERDSLLAKQYGLRGSILPQMPAAGRLNFTSEAPKTIGTRTKITLKGYGGTWGRAIPALRSLETIQNQLIGYEIHVTSVTRDVAKEIKRLQRETSLKIVPHPKFSLSSDEVREMLNESKFFVALSVSDGFPASLAEAMLCGTIPIQSDTACIPSSLREISPKNFVASENWAELGELLLALDSDPHTLGLLSKKFAAWSRNQALTQEEFRNIMLDSYGI